MLFKSRFMLCLYEGKGKEKYSIAMQKLDQVSGSSLQGRAALPGTLACLLRAFVFELGMNASFFLHGEKGCLPSRPSKLRSQGLPSSTAKESGIQLSCFRERRKVSNRGQCFP